jgi:hypothetical protein
MKTSQIESKKLDDFMRTMARVLGIPRRRLYKLMFQGQEPPSLQVRSKVRRSSRSTTLSSK